jgi:hypothetical protein
MTLKKTLAEIGMNHPKLRKRVVAIGEKIGLTRRARCVPA